MLKKPFSQPATDCMNTIFSMKFPFQCQLTNQLNLMFVCAGESDGGEDAAEVDDLEGVQG